MSENKGVGTKILDTISSGQTAVAGPSYQYYKYIKTPAELDMNSKGTLPQIGKNINGLMGYVDLLVSGNGIPQVGKNGKKTVLSASKTGKPLGNKFFLQTSAQCKPKDCTDEKCENVDRYIYVDNVPNGDIPFVSQGLGVNFSAFKGLIPGAMGNLKVLNPIHIMDSVFSGPNPECQQITMETIDVNNKVSSETHYVTTMDIANINPCSFPAKKVEKFETFKEGAKNMKNDMKNLGKKIGNDFKKLGKDIKNIGKKKNGKNNNKVKYYRQNPVTGQMCKETFSTTNENNLSENINIFESIEIIDKVYFVSLAILAIFIFYLFINKIHN